MSYSSDQDIIDATRRWVEQVVVAFNLCPFAKRELVKERVRFVVSKAVDEATLLDELAHELALLNVDDSIETTLLVHPQVLRDFYRYNDFLEAADELLVDMDLEGVYQVASFHPDYQFGGTEPDDAENYTNRSPYPMLHLLREDSLSEAIDNYPEVDLIPERNIECMNEQGVDRLRALLEACLKPGGGK
ncbi:MAG: DUF1415 domain-containing protein [Gammaproteobacteria bacterium]|uniref:DUF1415 domain-containing protein n=1 Tax=Limnobacter sp. TaxID=2003368 RepID=UPI001DE686F8|nr:DUF1415 domain-containing protein [Limnobacter sp.]MBU0784600.1 DUF1415 domain-containing protein [Gammaproteobacteria bacterium]MBU0847985.1 DUF1415 domain-containing protein [Gammaproteobacteria bacterium]MBU1268895.1 DUF1415 domain-containing protein [Gammaproteobacteria bacterium]MBU1529771.1 DUF1415 domain-containing protein [Gammaproteobacteria bacterium]MBU1779978.1 DUF1415 domain-containing protein [Gammaproteobacteria bacterium]